MQLAHGQEARFDASLPEGAVASRAADWQLWPPGVAGVRFEDEHRLHPIVQGGPRPGVALLSGILRVDADGMTGELRRYAHIVVGEPGSVGLVEMQGEAVAPEDAPFGKAAVAAAGRLDAMRAEREAAPVVTRAPRRAAGTAP